MSPEQAQGKPADKRADIWALGCVLYEMLTGLRAFAGDDVSDVLASVLAREPNWTLLPRGLSPVLGAFLKRCLHKDRKQRIGDAHSVRLALEGAFETVSSPEAPSLVVAPRRWRQVIPFAAAWVAGGLLVGLTTWSLWPKSEAQAVNRFNYDIPPERVFRDAHKPVMALSSDGRHFVYNTTEGLYLRSMGTLEARQISGTEGREGLANPFFAPDGDAIGYFQGGELKRISINGGMSVVICAARDSFGASWGRTIRSSLGSATASCACRQTAARRYW